MQVFSEFDVNEDGKMPPDAFCKVLRKLRHDISLKELLQFECQGDEIDFCHALTIWKMVREREPDEEVRRFATALVLRLTLPLFLLPFAACTGAPDRREGGGAPHCCEVA